MNVVLSRPKKPVQPFLCTRQEEDHVVCDLVQQVQVELVEQLEFGLVILADLPLETMPEKEVMVEMVVETREGKSLEARPVTHPLIESLELLVQ